MTDFDALADDLKEQTDSDDGEYESELPDAVEDAPILNVTPQCAIEFDEIVDIGMAGGVTDEQNIRVDSGFGSDLVVTLRNPTVADGTLFAATNGAAADYKLVDLDNAEVEEDASKEDGEWTVTGILVYGHSFDSEEVEDFGEGHATDFHTDGADTFVKLFVGSAAGQRLAMQLDSRGGESAYYADEDKTSGLIEYPPRYSADDYNPSDDGYPRLARTPTLRSDMRGEAGTLFFYMDEDSGSNGNAMHKVTSFNGEADPTNALTPPTADDELGEPEYPPYIVWDDPAEDDADSDSDDISMDALDNSSDESVDIEDISDLPSTHQTFVEKARDSVDTDETDVGAIYEQFCDDNDLDVVGTDIVVAELEG